MIKPQRRQWSMSIPISINDNVNILPILDSAYLSCDDWCFFCKTLIKASFEYSKCIFLNKKAFKKISRRCKYYINRKIVVFQFIIYMYIDWWWNRFLNYPMRNRPKNNISPKTSTFLGGELFRNFQKALSWLRIRWNHCSNI